MSGFLKQNGKLVIAHSQSRREINDFHSSYGDPISNDFLPTSQELASIFKNFSLNTTLTIDDETKYLVIGTKSY